MATLMIIKVAAVAAAAGYKAEVSSNSHGWSGMQNTMHKATHSKMRQSKTTMQCCAPVQRYAMHKSNALKVVVFL